MFTQHRHRKASSMSCSFHQCTKSHTERTERMEKGGERRDMKGEDNRPRERARKNRSSSDTDAWQAGRQRGTKELTTSQRGSNRHNINMCRLQRCYHITVTIFWPSGSLGFIDDSGRAGKRYRHSVYFLTANILSFSQFLFRFSGITS